MSQGTSPATPAAIVREACHVIWTVGDVDRIGEFYAEDYVADYPMTDWGTGLAGAEKLAREIRAGFPDYREEIEELIDAGDTIVVVLRIRGTHTGDMPQLPATGREVDFRDVSVIKVADGRIVSQRGLSDLLTYFLQLGLVSLPGS